MLPTMNPQDPNQDLGQTVPFQPGDNDPGFFQRLQSNGVLGMPLGEALLRFGSGILSAPTIQEGLSRGGASLVQGSQQARSQQSQDARFNQGLKMQDRRLQQSQEAQAAAQERQDATSRRTQATALMREGLGPELAQAIAAGTATPEQQAQAATLLREAQAGAARTNGSQDVMGFDPVNNVQLQGVRDPTTRQITWRTMAGQPVTDQDQMNRIQVGGQAAIQNRQVFTAENTAYRNFVSSAENLSRDTRIADVLDQLAAAPSSGPDLASRFGRLASSIGINIPGLGPNTTLQQLRNFWFTEANQSAFRQRIQGLAPISNVDVQAAMNGLLDPNATPDTVRFYAAELRRATQSAADAIREAREKFGDPTTRTRLFSNGAFTDWSTDFYTRQAERAAGAPPPFTTNGPNATPQAPQITVGPNGVRSVPNPPPPATPNPSAPPPPATPQASPRGAPSPMQGGPLYSPDFGQNPVAGQRSLPWQ